MKPTTTRLKETLFSTLDGSVACNAINKLFKLVKKGDADAKAALAEYVSAGQIPHMRSFACSQLADAVDQSDSAFIVDFQKGLSDATIRYWSILGYLKVLGREAYAELVKIACDNSLDVDDRGHAIKCLAKSSNQKFDRGLPSDPGMWQANNLRIDEIINWEKAGYRSGTGYKTPKRDPALDQPGTDLEKVVSRLDKRLAKKRLEDQDSADPTNWLAYANQNELRQITDRWNLPSNYLEFLTRFSPVKVIIENRRFYNCLFLFGAGELIEAQNGYAFNPIEEASIDDWPNDYLVIASHGGDPFVLDLSQSDGTDAPILTAEHGMGSWEFGQAADSFLRFLGSLTK